MKNYWHENETKEECLTETFFYFIFMPIILMHSLHWHCCQFKHQYTNSALELMKVQDFLVFCMLERKGLCAIIRKRRSEPRNEE